MDKRLLFTLMSLCMAFSSFSQIDGYFSKSVAPNFRTVNGVYIGPSKKFVMVGGWPENDAISTTYKSDDLGATWTFVLDKVDAMLNDCSFGTGSFGCTVGRSGIVYITSNSGESWDKIEINGNAGSRDFNAVYFVDENTGFIVGGNESNDAIQTILKTTDGGKNWSIQKDNLNPWLRDVYALDANNVFACGDGVVIKSTDGGSNWAELDLPGNASSRKFNSVWFIDENNGFVGGGHPTRDSIQTLLKTTDGGENWSIVYDSPNPMINKVYFVNQNIGYVVGDHGLILQTIDGGDNWKALEIKINDGGHIHDVYFLNKKLGLFGGYGGKVLIYNDTTKTEDPNVTPSEIEIYSPIEIVGSTTARVKGRVHPHGDSTYVKFVYGEDKLTNTVSVSSAPYTQDEWVDLNFTVENLEPNKLYHGRFISEHKTDETKSDIVSFYTGYETVPNFSFENWTTELDSILSNWGQFGELTKVNSYNSTFAAKIQSDADGRSPGAIVFGNPGDNGFKGGIEYSERPDSLVFRCNYSIAEGDSATVIIGFKDNIGEFISMKIHKFTGSSNNKFLRLAFPVEYMSSNDADSLVLGIACNNAFADYIDKESYLIVDNVEFIGATEKLPNWEMEQWGLIEKNYPVGWASNDEYIGKGSPGLERFEDAQHGSYAIKVSNLFEGEESAQRFAYLRTGSDPFAWDKPSFEVTTAPRRFYAHIKYYPDLGDTLFIISNLYEKGQVIGNSYLAIEEQIDEYQRVETMFNYYDSTSVPDSASIQIYIRKGWHEELKPGDSYAIIDNISFDGVVLGRGKDYESNQNNLVVYPNPFSNSLVIKNIGAKQSSIRLYSIDGKLIESVESNKTQIEINTLHLEKGIYILTYKAGENYHTKKIIKK